MAADSRNVALDFDTHRRLTQAALALSADLGRRVHLGELVRLALDVAGAHRSELVDAGRTEAVPA